MNKKLQNSIITILCFTSLGYSYTNASDKGLIGDLFNFYASVSENGATITNQWRLDGKNIKDNTINNYEIDNTDDYRFNSVELKDANTKLEKGGGNSLRIKTNNGYIDIGPQNSGTAHFITDRPSFYFNKKLIVNEGMIGSYDEDLNLQTQGTNRITIKRTNGNVGIGTTNPATKLHTSGDSLTTGKTYIGSTDSYFYRDSANRIATPDSFYVQSASPATYLYSATTYLGGSSGDITHLRGNNFDWNQGVIQGDGNVGIGTTSPSQKLDVVGNAEINGQILKTSKISFDQGTNFSIDTNTSGLVFDGGDGTADFLVYDERAYTDNLVMGYAGTANLTTYDSGENLIIDPAGNGTLSIATSAGGSFKNGKGIAIGDSDTGIRQDGDGILELWTNNVERAHIAANGNVGIGTANPVHKLDVNGNIRTSGRNVTFGNGTQNLYGDNSSALYYDSNHDSVSQIFLRDKQNTLYGKIYGDGNGTNFGLTDGDGNWSYRAVKDDYTTFNINNVEKMRIKSNGNVGIGTTNPSQKLQVNGNEYVTGYVRADGGFQVDGKTAITSNNATHQAHYPDTSHYGYFAGYNSSGTRGYYLGYGNGSSTVNLHLDSASRLDISSGDVTMENKLAIGHTNPNMKLDIRESGRTAQLGRYPVTNHYGSALFLSADAGSNERAWNMHSRYAGSNKVDLTFETSTNSTSYNGNVSALNYSEKMRITSDGNVGIGTTTPGAKLDVNGSIFAEGVVTDDAGGKNLIPNWQMESDTYWTDAPEQTSVSDLNGVNHYAHDADETSSTSCYNWASTAKVPIDPKKTYKFSIFIKSTDTTMHNYFGFTLFDANDAQINGDWANPYFKTNDNDPNKWKKWTAYIGPHYAGGASACDTTKTNADDWCFSASAKRVLMRFGSCYADGDNDGHTYFMYPKIEEIDPDDRIEVGTKVFMDGNIGIGTDTPTEKLDVAGNIKANRFIDKNSTSYYLDPASTSYLNDIRPNIIYDRNDTTYYLDPNGTSSTNNFRANRYYDRGNLGYYLDPASTSYLNDIRPNIIYDKNDTTYYLNPNGTSSTNIFRANKFEDRGNTGYYGDFASTSNMNRVDMNDARSNIFYDKNDTSYYVDPNSTSVINNLRIKGTKYHTNSAPTTYFEDTDNHNFIRHINGDRVYWMHDANDNNSRDDGEDDRIVMYGAGDGFRLGIGISTPTQKLDVVGNIKADIIYDRNDTSYYINSNSVSYMNDLRTNIIYDKNDTTYYLNPNGTSSTNIFRANKFEDRGNTGYYGDFASTSNMNRVDMNDTRSKIYYDKDNTGYYGNFASTSRMNRVDMNDARADIFYDRNDTNYYVNPAGTSITNDMRAKIFYDQDNTSYYVNPAGTSITNDMRAKIFYDQDNTGYYGNFASTSRMNRVDMNDARADKFYDRSDTNFYADLNGTSSMNIINASKIVDRDNTGYYMDPNSNSNFYRIYVSDLRSSIYYDKDNTSYYGNFDSTSNMNRVTVNSVKTTCIGNCY